MYASQFKAVTVDNGEQIVAPSQFYIKSNAIPAGMAESAIAIYGGWLRNNLAAISNSELHGYFMTDTYSENLLGKRRVLNVDEVAFTVPRNGMRLDRSGSIFSIKVLTMPTVIRLFSLDENMDLMAEDAGDFLIKTPGVEPRLHLQDEYGMYCTPESLAAAGTNVINAGCTLVGVDFIMPSAPLPPFCRDTAGFRSVLGEPTLTENELEHRVGQGIKNDLQVTIGVISPKDRP